MFHRHVSLPRVRCLKPENLVFMSTDRQLEILYILRNIHDPLSILDRASFPNVKFSITLPIYEKLSTASYHYYPDFYS